MQTKGATPELRPAWRVYLLECADGSLYCGSSTDPERRLRQHNGELPGGARYTRGRRPVRLLAVLDCAGRGEALRLESSIKTMPRSKKLELFGCGFELTRNIS